MHVSMCGGCKEELPGSYTMAPGDRCRLLLLLLVLLPVPHRAMASMTSVLLSITITAAVPRPLCSALQAGELSRNFPHTHTPGQHVVHTRTQPSAAAQQPPPLVSRDATHLSAS